MSLYNEVRPKTLNEVQGQNNIKNQLSSLFISGRIPNAMLFTGPRGTGKTTVARIVAKTLNCENGTAEPCNECQSCKDIMSGKSMDVIELDAASNNKVEDVRSIIEKAQYKPLGKYKVFILDEVHMFSTGAWNALLKTIEEPPANCIFILCTTEEHKVPATIISRCMKFYFEKLQLDVVAEYLAQICDERGKAYDEDALKLIAQASEGCMRDALSIMESFFETDSLSTANVANTLGMSQENAIFDILMAISSGDASKAISTVRDVSRMGRNLQLLVKGLVGAISDAIFVKNGTDIDTLVNTAAYKQRLAEYVPQISVERCLELSKQFSSVYGALTKTPDADFLIETSIIGAIECEAEIDRCYRLLDERLKNFTQVFSSKASSDANTGIAVTTSAMPKPVSENSPALSVEDEDGFVSASMDDDVPFDMDTVSADVQEDSVIQPSDAIPETPFEVLVANASAYLPIEEDEFDISLATSSINVTDNMPSVQDKKEEIPTQQPKTVADANELLSHLPKGTKIKGMPSVLPEPKAVKNDISTEAVQSDAGETEPLVKANNDLPPLGFDGFSGWL